MRPRKPEPDGEFSDAVGPPHRRDDLGAEALQAGEEASRSASQGHDEKPTSQDASAHPIAPAAAAPAASIAVVSRPLCGVWSSSALRRLPRFPDRDSFPLAKALIKQFLEGAFSEGDLRIALFWLGFGLLGSASSEEAAVNLVPLCKDLDTYADIALELGYDPHQSVHNRPVLPDTAELEQCVAQLCGCSGGSSSSTACAPEAAILEGRRESGKDSECCGFHPAPRLSRGVPLPRATASSSSSLLLCAAAADHQQSFSDGDSSLMAALAAETVENEDNGYGGSKGSWRVGPASVFGAQSSSSSHPPLSTTLDAMLAAELGAQQVLSYKVKLNYAGGWASSDNSSSEGQRTPPQPGTGSQAAGTSSSSSAGLDACYVDQFTVSYISDLGEGLEEIAEPTGSAEPEPEDPEPAGLCAFCLDDMRFGELLCRLPCMHIFHQRCVHEWLKRDRRCMLCRSDITMPRGSTCG